MFNVPCPEFHISNASTRAAADRSRLRLPLRVLRNGGSRGGWWDSKCASCTRVLCGPVLSRCPLALEGQCRERESEIDPLQATAGQQSLVQTPVCEESQFSV